MYTPQQMQAQAQQQKNLEINGLKKIEEESNIILKPKTSTTRANYGRKNRRENGKEKVQNEK